jgi:penicillin-binding protein 1A
MRKKSSKLMIFLTTFVWLLIVIGICVAIFLYTKGSEIVSTVPEMDDRDFTTSDSTVIYDTNGDKISEEGLYLKENIEYEDMPNVLIDAVLSIEDSRFYEHNGFDISRFSKAALVNLKNRNFSQGGSTLTMQLLKNTYFQLDRGDDSTIATKSIDRKVQEIYMSVLFDKNNSKDEVFKLYFNKLNFGGNIRGVEKAAEFYFGKTSAELNIQESAILAGLVNLPNIYSPYASLLETAEEQIASCTGRRNEVIEMMLYHGYITELEAQLAKSIKVENSLLTNEDVYSGTKDYFQSYIDTVNAEAISLTGKDPVSYPMEIHTYMDPKIQTQISDIQNGNSEIIFNQDNIQSAIVTLNNQTGAIVGIGGGNNQDDAKMLNRVTDSYIQPGSAVKPFLSYALAFEHLGYSTQHVLNDRPITYRGTDILIHNFSNNYGGDVTIQNALARSLNIPAMLLLQDVNDTIGREAVVSYLQDLGFSKVTSEQYNLGYAIGGSSFIVSPLELANAHATLVNMGKYIEPHTINYIIIDGERIEPDKSEKEVLSEAAAYMALQLESYAVNGPYDTGMKIIKENDYTVYGKTGTSDWGTDGEQYNIPEGSAKDYWMIGQTTEYTNLVWLGFDKGVLDEHTYFTIEDFRYNLRGQITNLMLDTINEDREVLPLVKPDGIDEITYTLGTYPYAAFEGIGTQTTALIKSEFNNGLVSIYNSSNVPTKLTGVSGNYNPNDGSLFISWNNVPYFDGTNTTKNISLAYGDNELEVAYGKVLFNYGWIAGGPHFTGSITVNDSWGFDVYSETADSWQYVDPNDLHKIQFCGYYYYDNGLASNQQCIVIY